MYKVALFVLLGYFLVVESVVQIDEQIRALLMKKLNHCAKEAKASDADVDDIMNHRVPQTHEGQCVIFCMHIELHIQKPSGSIDKEGTIDLLEFVEAIDPDLHGKFTHIFTTCNAEAVVDPDPCLTAGSWAVCAVRESTALGIESVFIE